MTMMMQKTNTKHKRRPSAIRRPATAPLEDLS